MIMIMKVQLVCLQRVTAVTVTTAFTAGCTYRPTVVTSFISRMMTRIIFVVISDHSLQAGL